MLDSFKHRSSRVRVRSGHLSHMSRTPGVASSCLMQRCFSKANLREHVGSGFPCLLSCAGYPRVGTKVESASWGLQEAVWCTCIHVYKNPTEQAGLINSAFRSD